MKKYMSIISLIICIVMIFTFVACGEEAVNDNNNEINNTVNDGNDNNEINNSENNSVSNDNVANDSEVVDPFSAPEVDIPDDHDMSIHYTINYMGRNTNDPDIDKYTLVKDELERIFNITFDFSPASGKNNDMELIAAADVVPECAWIYLASADKAWTLYRDGLTRSIPMDYVQKYAPYMWKTMQVDKSFHVTQLVPGTDDQYYVLFGSRYSMYKLGSGTAVRLDWIENLGMQAKGDLTTIIEDSVYINSEAYLLNEFTDLIYDFTFSDPDMNGENDTYGLATFGLNADDFAFGGTLYSAFSMTGDYIKNSDNWAEPLIFSEANFKFFRQLGEWNNLGVMPKDFEIKTANDWIAMWSSGKYGATSFEQKQLAAGGVPLIVFESNPDAKIILTPPLLDSDGSGGYGRSYHDFMRVPDFGYFYVRKDVSDEKLKRILMVYDYMSNNPDGLFFCCYGIYDIHWGYDVNNYRITLHNQEDLPDDKKWEGYEFFYTPNVPNGEWAETITIREAIIKENLESVRPAMTLYANENWPTLGYTYIDTDFPGDWSEGLEWLAAANIRPRNNAYKEARLALINETSDADTVWENLKNTLEKLGYNEYIDALNHFGYLREELFFDGVGITPAEKYPLD